MNLKEKTPNDKIETKKNWVKCSISKLQNTLETNCRQWQFLYCKSKSERTTSASKSSS